MEIQTEVREFIIDSFMMGKNPEELTDDGSLLDLGIIDSTGVLELVGFIEEKYEVSVEDEDLVPENMDSIDNLVKYIEGKKA